MHNAWKAHFGLPLRGKSERVEFDFQKRILSSKDLIYSLCPHKEAFPIRRVALSTRGNSSLMVSRRRNIMLDKATLPILHSVWREMSWQSPLSHKNPQIRLFRIVTTTNSILILGATTAKTTMTWISRECISKMCNQIQNDHHLFIEWFWTKASHHRQKRIAQHWAYSIRAFATLRRQR